MTAVTFDAVSHTYRVDGREVPSVSRILQAAGQTPDYRQIPPATLAYARERGTYVDACCDLFDQDVLDVEAMHPEAVGYVEAWGKFRRDVGFAPSVHQGIVYHPELDYAGTFDVAGTVGTVGTVVDRKCTTKLSDTYALQLAAYAMPGIVCNGNGYRPARRLVVQLKPTGAYVVYDCEVEAEKAGRDDFAAFRAAVALARWRGTP